MNALDLTPVGALLDIGSKLIDRFIPDPTAAANAKLAMIQAQQSGELAVMANETALAKQQTDTNTAEATNPNVFVSGWRPYIGWVCGTGLAYQFLVYPILVAWVPKIVQLDMGTLITLLSGMLGFGAMRTVEKLKGVS